jgi:hypothetical protein
MFCRAEQRSAFECRPQGRRYSTPRLVQEGWRAERRGGHIIEGVKRRTITQAEDAAVAHLESNPTAIGAAPDGNKQHLPVTIASMSELGRHRCPAADQTPIGIRVDCWRRKDWLGSTMTCFCWFLFCSPHI